LKFAYFVFLLFFIPTFTLAQDSLDCTPDTYHGLDNQGNPACRDIATNQLVDPTTGLVMNSQTGEPILEQDQLLYIGAGIVLLIALIGIVKGRSKSKPEPKKIVRHGWTEVQKEKVRYRQDGKCSSCKRPPPRWEYDHIDGNKSNNDLDNCQGLCPNCHSVKTHE
jgi:hypothetical protein